MIMSDFTPRQCIAASEHLGDARTAELCPLGLSSATESELEELLSAAISADWRPDAPACIWCFATIRSFTCHATSAYCDGSWHGVQDDGTVWHRDAWSGWRMIAGLNEETGAIEPFGDCYPTLGWDHRNGSVPMVAVSSPECPECAYMREHPEDYPSNDR